MNFFKNKKIIAPLALVCSILACKLEQSSENNGQIIQVSITNAKPSNSL
jgi:hypothetical protein